MPSDGHQRRKNINGGLIIQTGPDDFTVAGTGMVITFSSDDADSGSVGILTIEEGDYVKRNWVLGRIMNGDQSHLRFPVGDFGIQKLKLYRYK